jgi:hypothetical protein
MTSMALPMHSMSPNQPNEAEQVKMKATLGNTRAATAPPPVGQHLADTAPPPPKIKTPAPEVSADRQHQ